MTIQNRGEPQNGRRNDDRGPKNCPSCGKPPVRPYTPFCSKRCQQVDLGRWLTGAYAIPGDEGPQAEEATTEAAGDGTARDDTGEAF